MSGEGALMHPEDVFGELSRFADSITAQLDEPQDWDGEFEGLPYGERTFIAVWILDGEVLNGGFYQYFLNHHSVLVPLTTDALQRIRRRDIGDLLLRGHSIFREHEQRYSEYRRDPDHYLPELAELDASYDEVLLEASLLQFARKGAAVLNWARTAWDDPPP